MLRAGAPLTDEAAEQHLAGRMERQAVLRRATPPMFIAVIDEMVLRRPIGGAPVMREQLRYLSECGEGGLVRLQVVPLTVGAYAGLGGAFTLATFDGGGDMVYLDGPIRGQVVEGTADVAVARRVWEDMRCEALSRAQSMTLVREVAESWLD